MKRPAAHVRTLAITFVLSITALVTAAAADVPEYTVQRTRGPIVIDGRLDEDSWSLAASTEPFQFPWWTAGDKEQTTVRMLWSDTFLYIAYECTDAHISATVWNTNGSTYLDDTVELFWNPNPSMPDWDKWYYMFEMNCFGNLLSVMRNPNYAISERESRILLPRIGHVITGTLNNDNDTDTGWVLEVAVRFEDYPELLAVAPQSGDMWRVGLNRCGGVTNEQFSQWSPSQTDRPSFHVPADFGRIVFSDTLAGDPVSVDETDAAPAPAAVVIEGVSPNPFNAAATISFTLAGDGMVEAAVYGIDGSLVKKLTSKSMIAGSHRLVWNGVDNDGRTAGSGVYIVRIAAAGTVAASRLAFVK